MARSSRAGGFVLAILAAGSGFFPGLAARAATPRTDLYGDPLPEGAIARLGTVHFRNGAYPGRVEFAPDGSRLASSGRGAITLWRVPDGRPLLREHFSDGAVLYQALLPGNRSVAVLKDGTGQIVLWDFASGREPRPKLEPLPDGFGALLGEDREEFSLFTVSPDGSYLAGATSGLTDRARQIQVWELQTAKELTELKTVRTFERRQHQIEWLGFSGDGRSLFSGGPGGEGQPNTVIRWDLDSGNAAATLTVPPWEGNYDKAVAVAADGKTLATAGTVLTFWDAVSGAKLREISLANGPVTCLAFSPGGRQIAGGGRGKTLYVWDVATGAEQRALKGHHSWVECVAFSRDAKLLASGGQDRMVRLWDAETGQELTAADGHSALITGVALSSDGKTAVTGSWDGTVRWWETATGKPIRDVRLPAGVKCCGVTTSSDGQRVAVGATSGDLIVLDGDTGAERGRWPSGRGMVALGGFSADGRRLAYAGGDGDVRTLDVDTRRELRKFTPKIPVRALCLCRAGNVLAASAEGSGSNEVLVWDVDSGRLLQTLTGVFGGNSVAVSADGRYVACGGGGRAGHFAADTGKQITYHDALRVWEVASGRELPGFDREPTPRWRLHRHVTGLAFSPDGKTLVSAEHEGRLIVYEVMTGLPRYEVDGSEPGEMGVIFRRAVAFSADGRFLASSGMEHSVLVRETTPAAGTARLSEAELAEAWSDLGSGDAAVGWWAMKQLYAAPQQATALLGERIRPADPAESARIPGWITDLDSEQFDVRSKATAELERLGRSAIPALENALARLPAAEARHRIEELLDKVRSRPVPFEDLRLSRAVEVLEHLRTPEARRVLERLAGGNPAAPLTMDAKEALRRLDSRGR